MNKNAIISVYDKSNLNIICKYFNKNKINIISTGNTAKYIKKIGFKCKYISDVTKFSEILDGKVKTLHPNIHASLLFDRNKKKQKNEFKKLKFPIIDFVIVNLYPFEEFVKKNSSVEDCINMIDIGGPTLLRSAAKNYKSITALCDPNDYNRFISNMNANNGHTSFDFKKQMAKKVFLLTSEYDTKIYKWISRENKKANQINLSDFNKTSLRYGENPHQKAFYLNKNSKKGINNNLIQGKQLSFNNIRDIETALDCINEFRKPTCVIIKHNSPCGVATNSKINKAFLDSKNSDKISAFGGIIIINRCLDKKTAEHISKNFYEIVLAPQFTESAKKILQKKKNLRLISTRNIKMDKKNEIYSVNNGYLIQQKNNITFNKSHLKLVSKQKCSNKKIEDLIFAFKVCKHVKSNAIVFVNNQKTIAIGAGQTSRIDSTKIAIAKIKKNTTSYVAASDGFFPFTDSIKLLIKNRCKAIIQPGGSVNDDDIINFSNKNKFFLFFSIYRFFKH